MGAGRFYAVYAARERADPEGHRLNLATLEHERRTRDLKAEHAAALAQLQRELAAGQAALRQAQADADRRQRQFEIANAACRGELETARAALGQAENLNAQLHRRLKQCEPLIALINAAATRDGSDQA
jgi:hypothetical protein